MDNTSSNDGLPNVGPFYGPIYIAGLLTAAMWSIVWLQTIRYFHKYPKDRIINKAMVVLLVALLNVELVLIVVRGYRNLISSFGDQTPAFNSVPEYLYILPISALMAVFVQSFLVHRIWIFFGRKAYIPVIFIPIALFELLSNIIYAARVLGLRTKLHREVTLIESYSVTEEKLMLAFYSISPVVDMTIAGFMCFYLSRKSHKAQFTGTATLLHSLAVLSINTGIWTTTFAFLTLILALRFPGTNYYAIPNFPLGALYVNSCLMNLNSRRSASSHSPHGTGSASTSNNVFQLHPMSRQEQISVTREQDKHVDGFARLPVVEQGSPSVEGLLNLKREAI